MTGDPTSIATAMKALGWRFDAPTGGYRRGSSWVSAGQAREALEAAAEGRMVETPIGLSETMARTLVGAGIS